MRYQSLPSSHLEENQETTKERALRQRLERRAELTYTASDYQRWAKNRNRVIAEREKEKADAKLLANEVKTEDDLDDTYIIFADEKMTINDFAKEVYLSDTPEIIEHIKNINPHLKRTSYSLIKGMPLTVSPWHEQHADEETAMMNVEDLADEFFTLTNEQQIWFSDHNDMCFDIFAASASVNAKAVKADDNGEVEEFDYSTQGLAATAAALVGAEGRVNSYAKLFENYEKQLKVGAEALVGVTGNAVRSHPAAKLVRTQMKEFEIAFNSLSKQLGTPSFIDDIQTKKINNFLGLNKRQIYKSGNFTKAISGLSMTPMYKKVMGFSKYLGRAGKVAFIIGVKDNINDIYNTCTTDGIVTMTCARTTVKNGSSMIVNYGVGEQIGKAGVTFAASSGGLSIGAAIGATYWWADEGGDISNKLGDAFEYLLFDAAGDAIDFASEAVERVEEWMQ
ncbi:hypothetical protein [Moritella viscosa]|uniref:hypothetical protein n=1 Tax=Moritella viscosa TaxID=80854 RepID=UPI0009211057|nr:hypothetical protein [Moritella viscosa]SGZ08968.1 Putative uncharacterized protein [Moritella viscosa]